LEAAGAEPVTVGVDTLSGDELARGLDAVARLRIAVFRSYPYLYDGSLDYERGYLEKFAAAQGAVIAVARDGDRVIGAATGCPLAAEHEAFSAPLKALGHDMNDIFYCRSTAGRAWAIASSICARPRRGGWARAR
jgi:hypothetical protein